MPSAPDPRLQEITHGTLGAMHQCWSTFHLLAGISEASKATPVIIEMHDDFFRLLWRTLFDQVLTTVAALLEDGKNCNSIPRAFVRIKQLKDKELMTMLPELQRSLDDQAEMLARIVRWRHLVIAHHTEEGNELSFQLPNRMSLTQLEACLETLTVVVQALATRILSAPAHIRSASVKYKASVLKVVGAISS